MLSHVFDLIAQEEQRQATTVELIASENMVSPAVLAAAEKNEPYIVSRATMEVCTAFNKFYFCNQIITEDAGVSAARLALTDAARITIKKGLYLVGLQAPERM